MVIEWAFIVSLLSSQKRNIQSPCMKSYPTVEINNSDFSNKVLIESSRCILLGNGKLIGDSSALIFLCFISSGYFSCNLTCNSVSCTQDSIVCLQRGQGTSLCVSVCLSLLTHDSQKMCPHGVILIGLYNRSIHTAQSFSPFDCEEKDSELWFLKSISLSESIATKWNVH